MIQLFHEHFWAMWWLGLLWPVSLGMGVSIAVRGSK
jgi:hypothetical protein